MFAHMNSQTRQLIGWGTVLSDPLDTSLELVEFDDSEALKLHELGEKYLGENGTITVTPPPPPPLQFNASQGIEVPVTRTTTATPLEMWRLTLEQKHGYKLIVEWIAVDAGNGAIKTQRTTATIERLLAGPLLIGRTDDPPHATTGAAATTAGVANWTLAAAFVGNDLVLSAVGVAGRTVDWSIWGTMRSFAPAGA